MVYKPGSVSHQRRWPFICDLLYSKSLATYPDDNLETDYLSSLFGLAPGGVYTATLCYQRCGALLPHLFTLTRQSYKTAGGIFSAALSRGSPLPAINRHRVSMEPGLSSHKQVCKRPSDHLTGAVYTKYRFFVLFFLKLNDCHV